MYQSSFIKFNLPGFKDYNIKHIYMWLITNSGILIFLFNHWICLKWILKNMSNNPSEPSGLPPCNMNGLCIMLPPFQQKCFVCFHIPCFKYYEFFRTFTIFCQNNRNHKQEPLRVGRAVPHSTLPLEQLDRWGENNYKTWSLMSNSTLSINKTWF